MLERKLSLYKELLSTPRSAAPAAPLAAAASFG
jgi:hypothetical protein